VPRHLTLLLAALLVGAAAIGLDAGEALAAGFLPTAAMATNGGYGMDEAATAVSAAGDVAVIAEDGRLTGGVRRPNGTVVPVPTSPTFSVYATDHDAVVFDGTGAAVVAFSNASGVHEIRLAAGASTWTTLNATGGDPSSRVSLGRDGSGNVTFVYTVSNAVHERRLPSGGTSFAAPVTIASSVPGGPQFLTLAVGPTGRAVAAWLDNSGTGPTWTEHVDAAVRSTATSAWTTPVVLDTAAGETSWGMRTFEGDPLSVAVGPGGQVGATWTYDSQIDQFGNGLAVRAHTWGDPTPGAWGPAHTFIGTAGRHDTDSAVTFGVAGNLLLSFYDVDGGGSAQLRLVDAPALGPWPTVPATVPGAAFGSAHGLLSTATGALIDYSAPNAGVAPVHATTRTGPAAPWVPVTLASDHANYHGLAGAVDPVGDAVVAWPSGGNGLSFAVWDGTAPKLAATWPAAGLLAGHAAAFTATTTDTLSSPTVTWTFGDGTGAAGVAPTHAYAHAGSYTVVARATDGAGNVTQTSHAVTVAAPTGGGGGGGGGKATPSVHLSLPKCPKHVTGHRCARYRGRARAWKTLRGTVSDKGGTVAGMVVRVSLARGSGSACRVATSRGFRRRPCGQAPQLQATRHGSSWSYRVRGLVAGRYAITVRATDRAGNVAKVKTKRVRLTS
jgi:hypothetical protein